MRRRVPFVFQMATAECGLACLAMVAGAHGRRTTLAELRTLIEVGRDGAAATGLLRAAPRLGLAARAITAGPDRWATLPTPWIALCEGHHFVVVERVRERGVDVLDPARGRRRLSPDEFAATARGVALLYRPCDDASEVAPPLPPPPVWRPLWAELRTARSWFAALIGITLMAHALTLASPLLIGRAVNGAGDTGFAISSLALGSALVVAATLVIAALRNAWAVRLQCRLDQRLAPGFFGHLVSLPHHELERRGNGDLMGRMESLTLARLALTSQVMTGLLDALLMVVATVALFAASPISGTVVLVAVVIQIGTLTSLTRPMHEATTRAAMCEGQVHGFTAEALQGIATLKSIGAEDAARRRFAGLAADRRDAEERRDRLGGRLDALLATMRTAAPLAVLVLGARAVADGGATVGSIVVTVGLATAAVSPAANLVAGARAVQAARSHLVRLADVWALAPEADGPDVTLHGAIELDQVGVRYPAAGSWAVRDVSLRIEPGEHVAVVGRSGSGKSTLVKVLAGLLDPTAGEIRFDGRPAPELGVRALRRSTGVVLQDIWLFAGTIAENVAVDRDVSAAQLRAALTRAGIAEEIDALPLGVETRLLDGGAGLSGGQRQRLALARALALDPAIVILDEATSNLDTASEAFVAAALAELGTTRITVAHRLSTVRRADRIVVMDHGTVVQIGTYDELAATPGLFADLVAHDTGAATTEPSRRLVAV